MDGEIREYSGYLCFPPLSDEQISTLRKLVDKSVSFIADIGPTFLELSYTGRDSSRFIVNFLKDAAAVVGNAKGEVLCEIDEDGALTFEFYSICSGQLFWQHGHIVRSESLPID